MKKRTVIILTLTIALLFGCCKHQAETSMSALFPSEINSIEVTFDIYPSETTRALNIDEITAVTEWVLALEMEQAPLDETETPSNYAGGVAWHFNVNSGDLTFSYADYDESAIFINDEWYALKNPSNPPIEESTEDEVVEFHGQLFHKSDLTEETLEWLEWYNSLSRKEQLAVSSIPADLYTSDDVGTSDSDAEE